METTGSGNRVDGDTAATRAGRAVLAAAVGAFLAIVLPVVWRGAPLADDFNNCIAPLDLGLGGFLRTSWQQLGAIRPARFLEILLTGPVCGSVPFGLVILVPLLLTLLVAWLARGVLRDVGTPRAWADVGGALWLFQPLGTEVGLWPAALHVPLGLALALASIRLYRRGRLGWAAVLNLAAALSVEQVILPLPLAAFLVAPAGERRRAAGVSLTVASAVVASFLTWPGANPRLHVSILERVTGLAADPAFYVGYPAVGLGLHSIPLAIWWGLPWSPAVLLLGAIAGSMAGPHLAAASRAVAPRDRRWAMLVVVVIIGLANVVVMLAVPHQGSPRVFAPTWLILSIAAAAGAASIRWRRPKVLGAAGGLFAAGAALSLILSVSVRIRSADFTERAAGVIAARVPEGGRVAICHIRRTVVPLAPRGAFAVHEFLYEWAARRAFRYYTGRHVSVALSGELWDRPCLLAPEVDATFTFDELLAGAPR